MCGKNCGIALCVCVCVRVRVSVAADDKEKAGEDQNAIDLLDFFRGDEGHW